MDSPVHRRAVGVMWAYTIALIAAFIVKGEYQAAGAVSVLVVITTALHYGWPKYGDKINVACLVIGLGVGWWIWRF